MGDAAATPQASDGAAPGKHRQRLDAPDPRCVRRGRREPLRRHVRELLVAHGVLPPSNRELAGFEAWVAAKLADIEHPEHSAIVRGFVVWNYLPRLRAAASREVLRVGEVLAARQSITVATEFLEWLQARGHALSELYQLCLGKVLIVDRR